ncbi:MAG: DUF2177 family protein [Rhodobacter sp.]|nr:DUF2177 family protein [Rhodobacter sp.]
MQLAVLYLTTAAIFLIADALMLRTVMAPLFERHIKPIMLDDIRLGAAAGFYLFYIAGLIYLVSAPALAANAPLKALIGGAVLGAVAYGTFEVTSYAILRDWSLQMVVADTLWGTVLTGGAAWAGVVISRALTS